MLNIRIMGVVSIMQIRRCVMKCVHIQVKLHVPYVEIRCFQPQGFLLKKEFAPSGSKFFPLREVSFIKKDANDDNCCSFQ